MYQTMSYEAQKEMKERQVRELLDGAVRESMDKIGKNSDETEETEDTDKLYHWDGIYGSPIEFGYRNKMEFSFGDEYKDGPLSLGLHKKGSTYDILNTDDCKLVHPGYDENPCLCAGVFPGRKPAFIRSFSMWDISDICFFEEVSQAARSLSMW